MSEPTPSQILVQDPLNKVTRAERRSLLGISTIALTIVKTGLIPTKIVALGIEFTATDRSVLLRIIALIVAYFLIAFLIYAISDFIDWRIKYNAAIKDIKEREHSARLNSDNAGEFVYPLSIARLFARPTSLFRALFEFILPIVVGIYTIIILLGSK